ncbi:unnamed protein product [Caenorhabditis sp. 36 PRJEB53466]|nr:unnamed protein product [Caenorhabditis sp. 36 PRJEB53466]
MASYVELFRRESSDKFRSYQEFIPTFDTMVNAVNTELKSMSEKLEQISIAQKNLGFSCNESCMNCCPDSLHALLGIAIQKKEEKLEATMQKEQKEPIETPETTQQSPKKPETKTKEVSSARIVALITEEEYKAIPKYQLGRFTVDSLNEIVNKMDEFLMKKSAILGKSNKQLTRLDRELLDLWREQESKAKSRLPTLLFFLETDIRPLLQERIRPSFAKAMPCLRHIRRIREERHGPLTFYFP